MKTDLKTEIKTRATSAGFDVKDLKDEEDKIEISKDMVDPIILHIVKHVPTAEHQIIEITRPELNALHEYAIEHETLLILVTEADDGIRIASTDRLINKSFDIGMESSLDSFEKNDADPQHTFELPNLYNVKKLWRPLNHLLKIDRGNFVGVLAVPKVSYQMYFDVKGSSRQIVRGGIMSEAM